MNIKCFIFALIAIPALVFGEALPLNTAMTPEEEKETGIDTLSQEKRAKLEEWLASFTRKALSQSQTYNESHSLSSWIRTWPDYIRPNANISPEQKVEERAKSNMKVFRVYENGKQLELEDGSLFTIQTADNYTVTRWNRGDMIEVTPTGAVFAAWALWNASRLERAAGDKIRGASASGERAGDSAKYFAGSFAITSISERGETLTLGDGSHWSVSPNHQFHSRTWKVSERIRPLQNSTDLFYPYTLTNLDKGIIVNARKTEN